MLKIIKPIATNEFIAPEIKKIASLPAIIDQSCSFDMRPSQNCTTVLHSIPHVNFRQSCKQFETIQKRLKMMVSDLNHLPGRVRRSDLVQSGRDTSPDVFGGLTRAHEQYITVISLWERPENTHLGLIWVSFGRHLAQTMS